ncbi:DUF6057 family protein [Dysgonomonas sp. Marseille-P4361]|uniref:DUF6057 family protein n=1 Tax=Dysgonomonas sp. Marseille-P4361 TaxID=2161820 RepID=UPI001C886B4B|nr:DUF6057 family protein [Dysgonomonas sp. Marseille-P4361]
MKNIKKLLSSTIWLVIGITLFLLIQYFFEFHLYYAEQLQLFLYNKTFLSDLLFSFGGLSEIIGRWFLQFYLHPKVGALITTFLVLSVAIIMDRISKKINSNISLILLPLLTAVFFLFLHLDHSYYIAGTIAFILMLAAFLVYLYIDKPIVRIGVATVFTALLFWWGGSVAFLFSIAVLLWELLTDKKKILLSLIPLCLLLILAYVSVHFAWIGGYEQIFTPSLYFGIGITIPSITYFAWGGLVLLILLAYGLRNQKISDKNGLFVLIGQVIIATVITYYLLPIYGQFSSIQYKKLDYYARMERWNDIIEESKKPITNLLYAYYLNLALMETNQLGKQFFQFDQKGINGLVPKTDRNMSTLIISNEMNFALGDIAASQHYTFECNISISKTGSPRLYKRLVQTNLISGAYPVAEKYIKLLEQTHYYKEWATDQRRFLYNDQAVEEDPLLGKKRRGLPNENYLLLTTNVVSKLQLLAETDPTNRTAVEYLASLFLFGKQTASFIELIDKYYNTEEALLNMPEKFQEAIIVITEKSPTEWEKYKINPMIIQKYKEYKQMFLKNRNNPNLGNMLYQNFGNTYWSYFIFSN